MASPKPKVRPEPTTTVHIALDFEDQELIVRQFSDGVWAIEVDGYRLLLNTDDQMQRVVGAFGQLGKAQGWT